MNTPLLDDVISQLKEIRIQEATVPRQLEIAIDVEYRNITFAEGGRVRITNRVHLSRGKTGTEASRYIIVTCINRGTKKFNSRVITVPRLGDSLRTLKVSPSNLKTKGNNVHSFTHCFSTPLRRSRDSSRKHERE